MDTEETTHTHFVLSLYLPKGNGLGQKEGINGEIVVNLYSVSDCLTTWDDIEDITVNTATDTIVIVRKDWMSKGPFTNLITSFIATQCFLQLEQSSYARCCCE